jgi:hypothetical protein
MIINPGRGVKPIKVRIYLVKIKNQLSGTRPPKRWYRLAMSRKVPSREQRVSAI